MDLEDYLRGRRLRIRLHEESYDISLFEEGQGTEGAFAVIDYRGERTVVRRTRDDGSTMDRFRMLSVDADLPMDLVGLLAYLSGALAKAGIPIFVISSFRTDHIMIKEEHLAKAMEALMELGVELVHPNE